MALRDDIDGERESRDGGDSGLTALSGRAAASRRPTVAPPRKGKGFADRTADLLQQAVNAHRVGDIDKAERLYRKVLNRSPRDAIALNDLGILLVQRGQAQAGEELIRNAVEAKPDYAEAHSNLGSLLKSRGEIDAAIVEFQAAVAAKPGSADAHSSLGVMLQSKGETDAAIAEFQAAIAAKPDHAEAHCSLALSFEKKGETEEALAAADRALAKKAEYPEAHFFRANALKKKGELDQAIAAYRQAIALKPDFGDAYGNLGIALAETSALDEAAAAYRRALELKPENQAPYANLGILLVDMGEVDEAITHYRRALTLAPDWPHGHFGLSLALLLNGNFLEGWREYEWRWKGAVEKVKPRELPKPQWQGEDLTGKTLLFYAEQGLGDTLQFVRFVPALIERGARVVLETPGRLLSLLRTSGAAEHLLPAGAPLPEFDFHLAMLSLPSVIELTEETIPAAVPYLCADPVRVAMWQERLPKEGFRIGVVWQGFPNAAIDKGRSIPLRFFAPIAAVPGVRLISLQKNYGLDQLDALPENMRVETLGPEFDAGPDAFIDTAAVMVNLDMIITSDTSVAHVAGALGRPVWIVLKTNPDWRWLLGREGSPWYPTARLFRQRVRGDWEEAMERVAAELALVVAGDTEKMFAPGKMPSADDLAGRARAAFDGGFALHRDGASEGAAAAYCKVVTIDPGHPEAYSNLGVIRHSRGQVDEAITLYRRAISLKPDHVTALGNLAVALTAKGDIDGTIAALRQVVAAKPDDPDGYTKLGEALRRKGDADGAIEAYRKAADINPDDPKAQFSLAFGFQSKGDLEAAIGAYRRAIALDTSLAQAHANLGVALSDSGQLAEGVAACRQALDLRPDNPQYQSNLGLALSKAGEIDAAIEHYRRAVEIDPNYAEGHVNLALALMEKGGIEEAIACGRKATELKPDYAEAHFNLSLALLLNGEFGAGWQEYEWRMKGGIKEYKPQQFKQPIWQGEDLAGKTLLLHTEQGFGDTLQFVRLIPGLVARGARVVLGAPAKLVPLLRIADVAETIVPAGAPLPQFHFHVSLMSLPSVIGLTKETIPADVPYLFADPARVVLWQERLPKEGLRIGVVWQGFPNAGIDKGRSIPLRHYAPIAAVPGVRLISLQKNYGLEQLDAFPPGMRVETLGEEFDSGTGAFLDTAAVMAHLDLIITSDTSIAHVAGALGRPVWILVKFNPDWRWLLEREDSPWYPSARLFRQREPGDWEEVLRRVAAELALVAAGNTEKLYAPRQMLLADDRKGRASATFDRGFALHRDGSLQAAAAAYCKAVTIDPGHAEAYSNLGVIRQGHGRIEEAIKLYRHAISIKPDQISALSNLAVALTAKGDLDGAIAVSRQAVAAKPGDPDGHLKLGDTLRTKGDMAGAVTAYQQALALNPNNPNAHMSLGSAFRDQGQFQQAIAHFECVLARNPNDAKARLAHCMSQLPVLHRDEAEINARRAAYERDLRQLSEDYANRRAPPDLAEAVGLYQPFFLPYQGRNDRDLQSLYGTLMCRIMEKKFSPPPLPAPPRTGEPIRLGIVSGYFREHSNWKIPIKGWLSQFDRNRFRLFGYYTSDRRDAATEAAAALCERFVQGPLSHERWRETILADAPHVLIYPEVGMDPIAAWLAAQRLARTQCNAWGHPVTSGFPTLDYFLTSELMEPPDGQDHYTEKLLRLPNLSIYYEPVEASPFPFRRSELGLRESATVYWCGQSLFKYLPQYDRIFPSIARDVPDSQFVFLPFPRGEHVTQLFRSRLDHAFAAQGLKANDHCVLLSYLDQSRFLGAIAQCDIVLDSIAWAGCNSTLESLAQDLPIVTLKGSLMRGRHSAAILEMIGVSDTIADTVDTYVAHATRLAHDLDWRKSLRERIAERKHRLYRDRSVISALENFLDREARAQPGDDQLDRARAAFDRAFALHRDGALAEAAALYSTAIALDPYHAEAHSNLGVIRHGNGRIDEAITLYRRAVALKSDHATALGNLAVALTAKGDAEGAIAALQQAIAAKPDYAEGHFNLALAFEKKGDTDAALAAFERAVACRLDYPEAQYGLANALKTKGRIDEAIAAYRKAIALKPDFAPAHAKLGIALAHADELDEAIAEYRRVLELLPDHVEAHSNLGNLLIDKGEVDSAIGLYRRAIALAPDWPQGHFGLALGLLLSGNLAEGWGEYEWRWKGAVEKVKPREVRQQQWQGEDLTGKTLLLHAEQGLGDTLQFARFIPNLPAHGGRIILETPGQLLSLLRASGVAETIMAAGAPLPEFDFHLPLMSLPSVIGLTEETIPADVPYLFTDPARVAVWHERLPKEGLRVGIVWQGRPDVNIDKGRSIPLRLFAPIAAVPGVRLISLQKNHGLDQLDALPEDMRVETLGAEFDAGPDAFVDTAAVLANLDLLITSDTSIVHVAGALGRPVWIALKSNPDWRWQRGREDSPWYPTARLFRQRVRGDWAEVMERVAAELAQVVTGNREKLYAPGKMPVADDRAARARAVFDHGFALHRDGSQDAAAVAYGKAVTIDPGQAEAYSNLGVIRHGQGRLAEAIALYRRAVAIKPDHVTAFVNLSVALTVKGDVDGAIDALRQAVAAKPEDAEGHLRLADVLRRKGDIDGALAACRQALALKPDDPKAHFSLAQVWQAKGDFDVAIAGYRRAIVLDPNLAQAHANLGVALGEVDRVDEGIVECRRAIELRSDIPQFHANLGVCFQKKGDLEEAIEGYRRAIAGEPRLSGAHANLGLALLGKRQISEAINECRRSVELEPDNANYHFNLSQALLLKGDFTQGWREYEWRLKTGQPAFTTFSPQPLWQGEDLGGRVILLVHEQGFGDTLQFCRFAPRVAATARVILAVPRALARLLRTLEGVEQIVSETEALPPFHLYCPFASLPHAFSKTIETIPGKVPYLRADAAEVTAWKRRLASLPGLRVGLVWSGNPRLNQPEANAIDRRRSISLAHFALLAELPGVSFVSLQKGEPASQVRSSPPGLVVHDWTDELGDFADTAALIEALDLVISVDTSVVHLVGALGKPVWILSRYDGCWRWLLDREDSPWYPTARLFHQRQPGDWDEVMQRVAAELAQAAAGNTEKLFAPGKMPPHLDRADHAQAAFDRGFALDQDGSLDEAAAAYCEAITLDPNHAEALSNLGVMRHGQNRGDEAITLFRRAIAIKPDHVTALGNLAVALIAKADVDGAIAALHQVVAAKPDDAEGYLKLGEVLQRKGDAEGAIEAYRQAAVIKPDDPKVQFGLAFELQTRGNLNAAIEAYRRTIGLFPSHAQAYANLGVALSNAGRIEEGIAECRRALALQPVNPHFHLNLAVALQKKGDFDQAIEGYRRVIELDPGLAQAYANLGLALSDAGRVEEGMAECRRALAVAPDNAQYHADVAVCLQKKGDLDQAIEGFQRAIALDPKLSRAHVNLGFALRDAGRLAEAIAECRLGVELEPDNAQYHFNLSNLLLLKGDFIEGWQEYEWRLKTGEIDFPSFTQPIWGGEQTGGRVVLLVREQGFGDTLQFCRYAALAAAKGRVVLAAPRSLARLLSSLEGVERVVSDGDPLPPFDLYCPLASLPRVFNTTIDTIPAKVPYLAADAAQVASWKRRLAGLGGLSGLPGLSVGLVWAGNARSNFPGLNVIDRRRSISLAHFAKLAALPGVSFVSLQKGEPALQTRSPPPGLLIHDWTDELDDFADTAALIEALDLVISVDTSVVHLAGALGKPVWILSRFDGCWRWLSDRDDSPWYPIARLFRQRQPGDWDEVMQRVAVELAQAAASNTATLVPPVEMPPISDRLDRAKAAFAGGFALHQQGSLDEAAAAYCEAITLDPNHAEVLSNLGVMRHGQKRLDEAITLYRRAIAIRPDYASALGNLTVALLAKGDVDGAIAALRQTILAKPEDGESHFRLAELLRGKGDLNGAVTAYQRAVAVKPDDPRPHFGLGQAWQTKGDPDAAIECYRQALALDPWLAEAHGNLGVALSDAGRIAEGIAACRQAITLQPDNPHHHVNLAVCFFKQGDLDQEIEGYRRAIALDPRIASAHANLGFGLLDNRQVAEAIEECRKAVELEPHNAKYHFLLSQSLLLNGDFTEGWQEYQWRLKTGQPAFKPYPLPLWTGEEIGARVLLVVHEQGFGDMLQFCRFAPLAAAKGRVILAAPRPLVRLLGSLEGVERVVCEGDALPPCDLYCPVASLPHAFNTTVETIPAKLPYLSADAEEVDLWRHRVTALPGLRVGLVWAGSPRPNMPGANALDRRRSMTLAHFARLAEVPGVSFVSLQKGSPALQASTPPPGLAIHDWTDELDDFADTAALIEALDLVISVDTSVAHLAGALGKPVWILSRFDGCWRWLSDRDDSQWYPTARLFRQRQRGDWDEVVQRVAAELAQAAAGGSERLMLAQAAGTRRDAIAEVPSIVPVVEPVLVPVAVGELADKITILEIKAERITDTAKLRNVRSELEQLRAVWDRQGAQPAGLEALTRELKKVNESLWDIEDEIRDCERAQDFGPQFIALARAVYRTNDRRAEIKREINLLVGSNIIEEKSYRDYQSAAADGSVEGGAGANQAPALRVAGSQA